MSFRDFLADRIGFIVIYWINVILIAAVVQLDLLGKNVSLDESNIAYMALLSAAGLIAFLILDYIRQRGYFTGLRSLKQSGLNGRKPEAMEGVISLPTGVTREQRMTVELLLELYGAYTDRLEKHRISQDHHQTFVRLWVHQMKTPVSVIGLLTEQPHAAPTEAPQRPVGAVLESIQEENEKLRQGLDMMLHTARLEKFEADLRMQKVDLLQAVRHVINEHKKACIRYRIYPKLIASHEACYIDTDDKWLGIILHQIVSNAIKYSKSKHDGSKSLIMTITKDGSGCHAVFQDEGIGIAEQDLPRVFDPFFTGENGRLVAESTGMGLFVAREACRRLGHRLEIESKLGEGTTVRLHFRRSGALHEGLLPLK
ncbi:sensor histidine kinase [Paenibacillus elgii]|uniref:sensor histidine kinase n=1 Tax=Paenibacillus elgii TaxID=189691 RepID=UPI002D7ADEB6|nr:sensor histidine kinase [Paenibacillus elgii]